MEVLKWMESGVRGLSQVRTIASEIPETKFYEGLESLQVASINRIPTSESCPKLVKEMKEVQSQQSGIEAGGAQQLKSERQRVARLSQPFSFVVVNFIHVIEGSMCRRRAAWLIDRELFCEGHKEIVVQTIPPGTVRRPSVQNVIAQYEKTKKPAGGAFRQCRPSVILANGKVSRRKSLVR
jgi:hypothetical protein